VANHPVTDAILLCQKFANLERPMGARESLELEELRERLEAVFKSLAHLFAMSADLAGWQTDVSAPGFLVRDSEDVRVYAPWNLVADFPRGDALSEFLRIAAQVRSGAGTICLSGSSAIYSTIEHVGDIDLCEYVSNEDGRKIMPEALLRAAALNREDLICFRLKISDGPSLKAASFTARRPWIALETLVSDVDRPVLAKCDFLANTFIEGAVEVTNVLILIESPSQNVPSFVLQEAPVLRTGGWVPRRLTDPGEIGRYVVFLRDSIESLAESNPCKAAKRALSLTRMLFLSDLSDSVIDLLRDHELARRGALSARLDLYQQLADMRNDESVARFESLVASAIETLSDSLRFQRDTSQPRALQHEQLHSQLRQAVAGDFDALSHITSKLVGVMQAQ
jgi:hypothetical protein